MCPHLAVEAIQIIPDMPLDKSYGVLSYLVKIRAIGWDPDPVSLGQPLSPIPRGDEVIWYHGLDLDVIQHQDRHISSSPLVSPDS